MYLFIVFFIYVYIYLCIYDIDLFIYLFMKHLCIYDVYLYIYEHLCIYVFMIIYDISSYAFIYIIYIYIYVCPHGQAYGQATTWIVKALASSTMEFSCSMESWSPQKGPWPCHFSSCDPSRDICNQSATVTAMSAMGYQPWFSDMFRLPLEIFLSLSLYFPLAS